MSEQENIQLIKANFEALNANDAQTFIRMRSNEFAAEVPGLPSPLNAEKTWMYNQGYLAAFPDGRINLILTITQDEYVCALYTATGTHSRPLRTPTGVSIPPTGKKFSVKGCSIYELKGGEIFRQWDFADMISLFNQLGLMPPM